MTAYSCANSMTSSEHAEVIVSLAGGVQKQAGDGGEVLVGSAEDEHVDRDLSTGASDGECLLEGRFGLKKTRSLQLCRVNQIEVRIKLMVIRTFDFPRIFGSSLFLRAPAPTLRRLGEFTTKESQRLDEQRTMSFNSSCKTGPIAVSRTW